MGGKNGLQEAVCSWGFYHLLITILGTLELGYLILHTLKYGHLQEFANLDTTKFPKGKLLVPSEISSCTAALRSRCGLSVTFQLI